MYPRYALLVVLLHLLVTNIVSADEIYPALQGSWVGQQNTLTIIANHTEDNKCASQPFACSLGDTIISFSGIFFTITNMCYKNDTTGEIQSFSSSKLMLQPSVGTAFCVLWKQETTAAKVYIDYNNPTICPTKDELLCDATHTHMISEIHLHCRNDNCEYDDNLTGGDIAGIVVSSLVVSSIIVIAVYYYRRHQRDKLQEKFENITMTPADFK